ncbi:hypothetical protein FF38_09756 [Lucilia cuprina]|uniref:Uncharacterized protein n=1 Tax=Lucilia cuprina TaxID=7375 RepID=A0A0L0BNP2_LUCCU|nr:hypothetical protein FF38_09756 [Lucilia cuprina]
MHNSSIKQTNFNNLLVLLECFGVVGFVNDGFVVLVAVLVVGACSKLSTKFSLEVVISITILTSSSSSSSPVSSSKLYVCRSSNNFGFSPFLKTLSIICGCSYGLMALVLRNLKPEELLGVALSSDITGEVAGRFVTFFKTVLVALGLFKEEACFTDPDVLAVDAKGLRANAGNCTDREDVAADVEEVEVVGFCRWLMDVVVVVVIEEVERTDDEESSPSSLLAFGFCKFLLLLLFDFDEVEADDEAAAAAAAEFNA